jgi:excisionase family DNA binding protein
MPVGPTYYKVHEVAAMFRLSKMSVYRMCHSGEITAKRIGRSFRIPAAELRRDWPELFESEGE